MAWISPSVVGTIASSVQIPSTDKQVLISDLSSAAVSAGGTGLANWSIWIADDWDGTKIVNSGSLGGDMVASGSPSSLSNWSNGRKAITFNGVDQWLDDESGAQTGQIWTVIAVAEQAAITSDVRLIWRMECTDGAGSLSDIIMAYYVEPGDLLFHSRNTGGTQRASFMGNTGITDPFKAFGVWRADDTVQGWLNGNAGNNQSGANANPTTTTRIRIGRNHATRYISQPYWQGFWNGEIAFVAMCNLDLSSQRTSLESSIDTYYGL